MEWFNISILTQLCCCLFIIEYLEAIKNSRNINNVKVDYFCFWKLNLSFCKKKNKKGMYLYIYTSHI